MIFFLFLDRSVNELSSIALYCIVAKEGIAPFKETTNKSTVVRSIRVGECTSLSACLSQLLIP